MKYFLKNGEVYAFEKDGSQDYLITEEFKEMTETETDKHLNPEKYFSEEEKEESRLRKFPPLTRRQFILSLLDYNILELVESKILEISDDSIRKRIQIEYMESDRFERKNPSVKYMLSILPLSVDEVDAMWRHAESL